MAAVFLVLLTVGKVGELTKEEKTVNNKNDNRINLVDFIKKSLGHEVN